MMPTHAARVLRAESQQLEPLRTAVGLEVCEADDAVWLRAAEPGEALLKSLQSIPSAELFSVLPDGQLCRAGALVPDGHLPLDGWQRLSTWMTVEAPVASMPGQLPGRVTLRLVADSQVREPNLLLTSVPTWLEYASSAPQVRLDRWHFAVSSGDEVLVRGLPLPPLPGRRLVEELGIAVPCGMHWSPAVDAALLVPLFKLKDGDLLLWQSDDRLERIPSDAFARATRTAVRQTARKARVDG